MSDIDYESDRTCFGKPQTAVTSLQPIHQTLFLSINGLEEESNKIIDNVRILIRFSGTEPVIRLLVEGEKYSKINLLAKKLQKKINSLI